LRLKLVNSPEHKYVQIDLEGYPLLSGLRVQDVDFGKEILLGIRRIPERYIFVSDIQNDKYIVEAFDQPYVIQQVYKITDTDWELELPYGIRKKLDLTQLKVDEWDRFQGRTSEDIPYVFSRKAQNEFFNVVDEFDDEGFTVGEQSYTTQSYLPKREDVRKNSFWSDIYKDTKNQPGWDLNGPTPILKHIIPQLKIPKSRILVLGCGRGHDAYELSQRGNVVTAVDFSEEAIKEAKRLYPENENLKFLQADVFNLPEKYFGYFDIVFEHTLFCAIDPHKRNDLVKVYKSMLADHGHLLGIFFTIDNLSHPPFGATEWEYRERLKKYFNFLYWTKWKAETTRSAGIELIIYAQKLNL
jgi:SAM-dependent methyltransferase